MNRLPNSQLGQLATLLNGRYRIEKELGRGGVGAVYLAHDEQMHSRPVVIKTLLAQCAGTEWFRKKFRDEMRALVRLDHPSVVGALDTGCLPDGQPFLVMEYVRGQTLRARMGSGELSLPEVADIVQQTGRALTAAHEMGICHRDLKPENIMLQDLGHGQRLVKIIDFGIATVNEPESVTAQQTQAVGTPFYMAPEQWEGRPEPASDTYALAVIAYEMLTGRPPFATTSIFELITLKRRPLTVGPSRVRPGLSPACDQVTLQGLSPDPRQRPPSAMALGDALSHALAGTAGQPDGPPAPTVSIQHPTLTSEGWLRRPGPWIALVLAVSGVFVVALVWAVFWHLSSQTEQHRAGTTAMLRAHSQPDPSAPAQPVDSPQKARSRSVSRQEHVVADSTPTAARPTSVASDGQAGTKDRPAGVPVERRAHREPAAPPRGQKDEVGEGRLEVAVKPWAEVFVDGARAGLTPMAGFSLRAGRHEIVLKHPSYAPLHRVVVIRPNTTEKLIVQLPRDGRSLADGAE